MRIEILEELMKEPTCNTSKELDVDNSIERMEFGRNC